MSMTHQSASPIPPVCLTAIRDVDAYLYSGGHGDGVGTIRTGSRITLTGQESFGEVGFVTGHHSVLPQALPPARGPQLDGWFKRSDLDGFVQSENVNPDAITELKAFRSNFEIRFGTSSRCTPSDIGQALALQRARLLAVSIILDIAPDLLEGWLDHVVWESELTYDALVSTRNRGGIPLPPFSEFNSGPNMHRSLID